MGPPQEEASDPDVLRSYEGLIFSTAQRIAEIVEEDVEDIRQIYRIKVYRALMSFDGRGKPLKAGAHPSVCRCGRCRYVFSCVKNQEKDLLKKKRRGELHIQDFATSLNHGGLDGDYHNTGGFAGNRFEGRYLRVEEEDVFGAVESGEPLLPATLTALEVQIVLLLYRDYSPAEVAVQLGLTRPGVTDAVEAIQAKLRPEAVAA